MRDLGRRLLIGLAAVVVGVMAVGYAFIFGGIATPIGADRGMFEVPPGGVAMATILEDGRPVFVVNDPDTGVAVLDAEAPSPPGRPGVAVAWCAQTRLFVDLVDGAVFAADGTLRWGPAERGLLAHDVRQSAEDPSRVIVGPDTTAQGRGPETDGPPDPTCPGDGWVVHEPQANETFDPSVAIDQEPPGWIWLEGTIQAVDDEVRLCDGRVGGCEAWAAAVGIDPASLEGGTTTGQFIGRVRDGAIENLILVPDPEMGS